MTWPFENDTSAIVKKLAGRSMQADKRNKAFLLLTIAISVCMVFSILLISTGTQEKFKNTQRNKAQIGILGVTDEQTAQLHQNENITWVGEYSALGVFYVENKTITVAYGNEDYFLHQEEKTFQGSVPQKADEIMLPQNYLDFLGKSYQTGDTISIDLTGTGQKAEYTLSGVLNNTKESNGYFIYVSKELAQDLAKDSFQVTAYTRLNTDAISSTAILDFAGKAIQNTGIVEEQVMLTEYSAVMSGVITSGIPIPVPLLAALTAILAATIVYGVFYTKIVKNVQMFGQLRTVGMTKRQIKRMASKEGRLYALAGIPLGLVIGVLIGFIGCPDGFRLKTTVIYAVLIAAVAFVTVNIAIFKPVRVAMNTSPVEGAKYLAYAGKAKSSSKLHRKLTPFNLAKINIQRNKQKAVLTLLMLGVSGALLLVTSTVAGSIDPAKQASFKYYPAGNIIIQIRNTVGSSFDNEAEPYGSAKLQLEENPLEDQALMQELEKVDGIEKITTFDSVYMTATFSGESGSITSISDFFPTLNREQTEEKQAVLSSGTADYNDMVEKNGILVAEDIAQVGDTLKIEGRAFDGRTFDVEAVVVGTYNRSDLMEDSPVVPGSPYFIMTYDTAKKLTGITEQTGILAVKNSEGRFDEVLTAVQKIADKNEKIEVNTIEQTIKNIQYRYSASINALYMTSAILFVFGSISLMNMLMVDFQNRKREFGLLEAVGTTRQQLKAMLDRVTSTVAGSIDPAKQASFKYYPAGNIIIQIRNTVGSSFDNEAEPYGSAKLQLEENPLEDQALMQELEKVDGIEKITTFDSVYMTATFSGESGSITSISDFFPTLNREQTEEKQAVLSSGTADYNDMVEKNGILVAEDIAQVGDTLKIEGRAFDGRTFDVEAVVVGTYNRSDLMEDSPVVPGSPYFIMTYDTAKKLTGITEQTGILAVKNSEGRFDEVLTAVQKIADKNEKIEVNTIEQTIKNIQYRYSASINALYMTSAILFVFGSISLMNMLMVDFQNRKREFGLLEAVGTTRQQLKAMLDREIGIYLGGSLAISLICGSIFSIIVCRRLDAINHCITLKLPWFFLLALTGILFVIYFVFSMYSQMELKKASILSAIKSE